MGREMDDWDEEPISLSDSETDMDMDAAILDFDSLVMLNRKEWGSDHYQGFSSSSDIYLIKNQAFQWDFDSELKIKKEYFTPIIFGWNKPDKNFASRGNGIEKPGVQKALEKSFNTTFPLSLERAPAMILQRGAVKSFSDYALFIQVNAEDDFYKKIRKAVTDPVLYVELKVDHAQGCIEIPLDNDDFSALKPFKKEFSRLVNKKLKKSENVEGTVSLKLRGVENKLNGTYEGYSLGHKLLNEKVDTDCTLVAGNGKEMKCHQLILKLYSAVFRSMLESGMKESSGKIFLESLNEDAMEAFLNFLYKWDVEEPIRNFSVALNLLQVGHMYEIKDLEEAMARVFKNRQNSGDHSHWNKSGSLEEVVQLYTFANNVGGTYVSVEQTCVKILKSRLDELSDAKWFDEIFRTDPALAKKLCLAFGKQ